MKINTILFFFLLTASITTNAQDFQLWAGANVKASFSKRFSVHYKQEVRLNNNWKQLRFSFSELGLEYGLNKSFNALVAYRLFFIPKYSKPVHRTALGLKYRHKWIIDNSEILGFSARYLYLRKCYIDDYERVSNTFRLKLEFKYSRKANKLSFKRSRFLLEPFVYAEGFYAFQADNSYFKRYRLGAGTYINLSKNQSLGVRYIFQQNYGDKFNFDSALSIGYKFRLKY